MTGFADNPLVLGDPDIRFYAGAPIEGPGGAKLGTICIIDRRPRELAPADLQLLEDLAKMVEREVAWLASWPRHSCSWILTASNG